jgi:hypothetical protein
MNHLFLWLRNIYAPVAFCVVVFIGLSQTVIAWVSGELAVKALTDSQLTSRKRKLTRLLFRTLAVFLLVATVVVGVLNDNNQRSADDTASRASREATITQRKLDDADTRGRHFNDSFESFIKSLDPSKLTVTQYSRLVEAQRAAGKATNPTVTSPAGTPSPRDGRDGDLKAEALRLTQLTNQQLKDEILNFQIRVWGMEKRFYDADDQVGRIRGAVVTPSNQAALQSSLSNAESEYQSVLNEICDNDIPLANLYIQEVRRRLGQNALNLADLPTTHDSKAVNAFFSLVRSLKFSLAAKIPT